MLKNATSPSPSPSPSPPENPVEIQNNGQERSKDDVTIELEHCQPGKKRKEALSKPLKNITEAIPWINGIVGKAGDNVLTIFNEKSRVAINSKDARKRAFVKCLVCEEFEEEARKFSGNNRVYMAQGVRCDGRKKLQNVIDHLHGTSHAAAVDKKRITALWNSKDDRHPWIKVVKSNDPTVLQTLTRMAVDVYNDSKNLTLAAWSWPSRSLAGLHAEQQLKMYGQEEEGNFSPYQPSAAELHYRDPMHYAEMLNILGKSERGDLAREIKESICFSVQMDGSVDMRQQDKKFIFLRFNSMEDPIQIETGFLSVSEAEERGAKGLFGALVKSLNDLGLSKEEISDKLVGVTTDGESANTGRSTGLWARIEGYVEHATLNFWCACHRSDLAMEDAMKSIPELKIWNSNLVDVATYYRTSGLRTKELKNIKPKMKTFPPHHEIRFAQHLVQLCEAALHNLDGCIEHWTKITAAPAGEYDKKEINTAKGFLKVWKSNGLQTWLTGFMIDICSIFRYIEKEAQKPNIIIADILRYRDIALQKLELLETEPYPGICTSCKLISKCHLEFPYIIYHVSGVITILSATELL